MNLLVENLLQDITAIHYKFNHHKFFSFHKAAEQGYILPVVAKSTTSRDKLNKSKANSTPNRAFFVRSFRTPKENTFPKNGERSFLPMVGRKGQPFAVGCFPLTAVCHPFTLYRQTVTSLAESLYKQSKDTAKMLFKFLFTGSRLRIAVHAKTLTEAYSRLPIPQPNSTPVLIARLPAQGVIYA